MRKEILICLFILLIGGKTIVFAGENNSPYRHSMNTTGADLIGGDFVLTDHNGKKLNSKEYRGKYLMIFFGFTKCTTACPVGLGAIMGALEELSPFAAKEIQPFFISVDPERDTQDVLKVFVEGYGPPLIGLYGSFIEIEKVANQFRAYYTKIPISDHETKHKSKMNYLMDHSTTIYFMGKDGKYLAHFASENGAKALANEIKKYL